MDDKKKPFMFTIWDDLADNEGTELVRQLHEHPVILAKRIAVSEYRGVRRLATRYTSSISINPLYVQATALMNCPAACLHAEKVSYHLSFVFYWSKENEEMLMTYTLRSSSASPLSLTLASVEDEVMSISTIPSMSSTI